MDVRKNPNFCQPCSGLCAAKQIAAAVPFCGQTDFWAATARRTAGTIFGEKAALCFAMFYGKRSRQLKPRAIWPSGVKGAALRALVPLPRSKGTAPAARAVAGRPRCHTGTFVGSNPKDGCPMAGRPRCHTGTFCRQQPQRRLPESINSCVRITWHNPPVGCADSPL